MVNKPLKLTNKKINSLDKKIGKDLNRHFNKDIQMGNEHL